MARKVILILMALTLAVTFALPVLASPPESNKRVPITGRVYNEEGQQVAVFEGRINDMHASIHEFPDGQRHMMMWDAFIKGDIPNAPRQQMAVQQHFTSTMDVYARNNGKAIELDVGKFRVNVSGYIVDPNPIRINPGITNNPFRGQNGLLRVSEESADLVNRIFVYFGIGVGKQAFSESPR